MDDETRQVKALANIISDLKPYYEIHTADNGQEALNFLLHHHADILMTDIKMPVMDGLELIEKLHKLEYKVKIVILSGYEEFEYAQKAIRFNVHEYLVKPISKKDLQELLEKIEKSIEDDRNQIQQQISFKKKLEYSLPVYIEHQLNRWIYGRLDEEGRSEITSIFSSNLHGAVVITSSHSVNKTTEEPDAEKTDSVFQHMKFSFKEILKPVGHTISFPLESQRGFIVTIISSDKHFSLSSYDNSKKLCQYITKLMDDLNIIPALGVALSDHCQTVRLRTDE